MLLALYVSLVFAFFTIKVAQSKPLVRHFKISNAPLSLNMNFRYE